MAKPHIKTIVDCLMLSTSEAEEKLNSLCAVDKSFIKPNVIIYKSYSVRDTHGTFVQIEQRLLDNTYLEKHGLRSFSYFSAASIFKNIKIPDGIDFKSEYAKASNTWNLEWWFSNVLNAKRKTWAFAHVYWNGTHTVNSIIVDDDDLAIKLIILGVEEVTNPPKYSVTFPYQLKEI